VYDDWRLVWVESGLPRSRAAENEVERTIRPPDLVTSIDAGKATEPPGHDYVGPTKPDPDRPGRRVPVADAVHERFHGSVGDVIQGKVLPEARKQMREALERADRRTPRADPP
jgi:hypothetical protein